MDVNREMVAMTTEVISALRRRYYYILPRKIYYVSYPSFDMYFICLLYPIFQIGIYYTTSQRNTLHVIYTDYQESVIPMPTENIVCWPTGNGLVVTSATYESQIQVCHPLT